MRITILTAWLLSVFSTSFCQTTPLRRSESFFGLHFDFHAGITDSLVGLRLTEGLIDTLLTRVKPDFIQVDSKGHPGVTSYPTKVKDGTHVKSFHQDPLALFRKVTRKHGVALYVHYSGVWDEAAIKKRPEWAIIEADGKPSSRITSLHSSYVDELLIPQLKEIADYGVDGVWVDGDCWATAPDYSRKAKELFQQRTGAKELPKKPGDPFYEEFMTFSRGLFKNYVQHYTTELHKYKPQFQVASNWAFSSIMPEPAILDVDFLSGDITPGNGVNSALFESRVLATQSKMYGKPWDLMSWSFNYIANTGIHIPKTAVNLNQEAAEIMATGGGYQCYFTQNRDASIRPQEIATMAELARFSRARQPFTQGAKAIPQIGLLYSWNSYAKTNTRVYSNAPAEPLRGVLNALMDAQYPVEVLTEYHLDKNLQQYPLIVIPEWDYLDPVFINSLMGYVNNGGNLLVIGAKAATPFMQALKATVNEHPKKELFWIQTSSGMATVNDTLAKVSLGPGGKPIGKLFFNNDVRYPSIIPASAASYGKGKIAAVYFGFGRSYINLQTPQLRDFLKEVVHEVFPEPLVKVNGSGLVHVTLNDLRGKTTVNLINAGGPFNSNRVMTYDELPVLPELEVSIRSLKRPVRITQQPENKTLPFTWSEGRAVVRVGALHIHSVLVLE